MAGVRRADYTLGHGSTSYRVTHYDLDLDYKLGPNRLTARARLDAVADEELGRIPLDLAGFTVKGVRVDGRAAKFTHRGEHLVVRPVRPVRGAFSVEVRYSGNPRPVASRWGEIGWDELTDGALVASQPTGAPSWFPCNDRPGDKATYRISLTTASAYTVLVTGDLVARRAGGSATTWVFERREPTASYLMSVQIGRYDELELARGQRIAVPRRLRDAAAHDFGRQPRMMAALGEWFGPYPFGEYVVVVTDDALDDPIEAQGMAIFGANHVDGRRTFERLVVHELAHQWFGNSLTVADWRHIWLNEGFATYAEWLWSEISGGAPADEHARVWRSRVGTDVTLGDPSVAHLFDEQVYKRGALTLHALRGRVGDAVFFPMLRSWAHQHAHGTVTTEDFIAHAERAAGVSLRDAFATWLG
ncbi:M1 family metallopeptidase [Amycolatopsis endophytica]|uniref:Aminopeptidase N n=1 Tax=Amycolatopsis endophytica TaxID=860233 RepID=A0A853BB92_9PSEU|nr:M1 family metallopeptidase [Amycolatopsis endophytica]NYI92653.1 aminopeptidase N [Amycolatopsis endophytica]